jgi:hypothetical protein
VRAGTKAAGQATFNAALADNKVKVV